MLLGIEESADLGSLGENSLYLFGTHFYYLENEGVEKEPLGTLLPILTREVPGCSWRYSLARNLGQGKRDLS